MNDADSWPITAVCFPENKLRRQDFHNLRDRKCTSVGAAVFQGNLRFPQTDRLGTIPLVVAIGHGVEAKTIIPLPEKGVSYFNVAILSERKCPMPDNKKQDAASWDATQWHEVAKGDTLSKPRKLPAGLDKFESAKASLPNVTQTWTEASDAFKAGNLMDAVGKATGVKEKRSRS
jgi:hypothetical protein